MAIKLKEFKTPTEKPVRVVSDCTRFIDWIYPEWTPIREELWKGAYSQGCISKDMNVVGMDPLQAVAHMQAQEVAFTGRVLEVMKDLIEEGNPDKLDAAGRPLTNAIGDILGKAPSASLRNRLYTQAIK
jgi:hypothetical protein